MKKKKKQQKKTNLFTPHSHVSIQQSEDHEEFPEELLANLRIFISFLLVASFSYKGLKYEYHTTTFHC